MGYKKDPYEQLKFPFGKMSFHEFQEAADKIEKGVINVDCLNSIWASQENRIEQLRLRIIELCKPYNIIDCQQLERRKTGIKGIIEILITLSSECADQELRDAGIITAMKLSLQVSSNNQVNKRFGTLIERLSELRFILNERLN